MALNPDDLWESYGEGRSGVSPNEVNLYYEAIDQISNPLTVDQIVNDNFAQTLYHSAFFDWSLEPWERQVIYEAFVERMEQIYGINWDEVYDWQAYRESIDS